MIHYIGCAWMQLAYPKGRLISCRALTAIVLKRSIPSLVFFVLLVANEGLNHGLKHYIQEPRPVKQGVLERG